MTLENGTRETIHLEAVQNFRDEDIPCLFSGVLDNDPEDSDVVVDGCQDDDQVLVEISSFNEVGGLLVLVIEDGITYRVKAKEPGWFGDFENISDHGNVSQVFNTSSITDEQRQWFPPQVTLNTQLGKS